MERHEVLDMMRALRLSGMRTVFDEIVAVAIKRGHPVQRVIGELLKAEIADKKARSIKYQMTIAKLPTVKELADFDFASSPVNELLVRDLATGAFLEDKRNLVLVGGTGSGKTHSERGHRARLHPQRRPGTLLQRRGPGQSPRCRGARRPPGPDRQPTGPTGFDHPRRARLPALCPGRRPVAVPSHQQAL